MALNQGQINAGVYVKPDGTISFSGGPPAPISPITAGFLGQGPAQNNVHGTGQGFAQPGSMGPAMGSGGIGDAEDWMDSATGGAFPWGGDSFGGTTKPMPWPASASGGGGVPFQAWNPSHPVAKGAAAAATAPQTAQPLPYVLPTGTPTPTPGGAGGVSFAPGGGVGPIGGGGVPMSPGTPSPSSPFPGGQPGAWGGPYGGAPTMQWGQGQPFGGQPQGGNENRQIGQSGLDPRLDSLYQFALQQAMSRYSDPNGATFYGGPTVAGLSPDELQAQNLLRGNVGTMQGMGGGAVSLFDELIQRGMNPEADATLNNTINATLQDINTQAMGPGGPFSQIRGNSIANGSYGGSRQGVMEGVTMGRLADVLGRTSADMRLTGRRENIANAMGAINQMPTITGQLTAPGAVLGGVGAQTRDMSQRMMDDQLRRWGYNTFEPDRRLDALFSRIGGAPLGGWQTGSSTIGGDLMPGATGGTSNTQNILGAVTGGLGIWDILRRSGIFGG